MFKWKSKKDRFNLENSKAVDSLAKMTEALEDNETRKTLLKNNKNPLFFNEDYKGKKNPTVEVVASNEITKEYFKNVEKSVKKAMWNCKQSGRKVVFLNEHNCLMMIGTIKKPFKNPKEAATCHYYLNGKRVEDFENIILNDDVVVVNM